MRRAHGDLACQPFTMHTSCPISGKISPQCAFAWSSTPVELARSWANSAPGHGRTAHRRSRTGRCRRGQPLLVDPGGVTEDAGEPVAVGLFAPSQRSAHACPGCPSLVVTSRPSGRRSVRRGDGSRGRPRPGVAADQRSRRAPAPTPSRGVSLIHFKYRMGSVQVLRSARSTRMPSDHLVAEKPYRRPGPGSPNIRALPLELDLQSPTDVGCFGRSSNATGQSGRSVGNPVVGHVLPPRLGPPRQTAT